MNHNLTASYVLPEKSKQITFRIRPLFGLAQWYFCEGWQTSVLVWQDYPKTIGRLLRYYTNTAPRTAQELLRGTTQILVKDCSGTARSLWLVYQLNCACQCSVKNNKYLSLMTQYLLRPDYMNNIDRVLSVAVQVREKFCSRKKTKWKIYGGKEYTLL